MRARSLALLAGPLEPNQPLDWVGDPRGGVRPAGGPRAVQRNRRGRVGADAALREHSGAAPQALADADAAVSLAEYAESPRSESQSRRSPAHDHG